MEIDKVYEPQRFEPHWAERWVDRATFHVEAAPGEPYFSLAIPPPNVTGSLHMGHMFEHSIIDAQIRWRRMKRRDGIRCGCRAPTTRASRRRSWWSGRSPPRVYQARPGPREIRSARVEVEGSRTAAASSSR